MARIEAERKDMVNEVKKGRDATELKFRLSIHGEDVHAGHSGNHRLAH